MSSTMTVRIIELVQPDELHPGGHAWLRLEVGSHTLDIRVDGQGLIDPQSFNVYLSADDSVGQEAKVPYVVKPRGAPGCTCGTPPFAPPEPSADCPFHGVTRVTS